MSKRFNRGQGPGAGGQGPVEKTARLFRALQQAAVSKNQTGPNVAFQRYLVLRKALFLPYPLMGEGKGGGEIVQKFKTIPPPPTPTHQGRGRFRPKNSERLIAKQRTSCSPTSCCLLVLLVCLLLAAGCGKKKTPLGPDEVLPAPVREFRLSQEGQALVLSWLLPRENLLGQPLTQVAGCRVYRADAKGVSPEASGPLNFVMYAEIDLAYPKQGEVRGEALLFRDRELTPGHRYFYRVAAYDQNGYLGGWSRTLSHAWGALPLAPRELKAAAGDKVVQLTWTAVDRLLDGSRADLAGYLVFRRSGDNPWMRLTPEPVPDAAFQDLAVLNDVEYTYQVQAVRRLGGDLLAGAPSPTRTALPEKRTPPPPLLDLLAVPTSQGAELRWEPSPAPDLAGYRVYRRVAGEAKFALLTPELLTRPYFVDGEVSRGRTYHYYVTAVDDSPRRNESLPSEEAEVGY